MNSHDGVISIEVPSNAVEEMSEQIQSIQEKLVRIITGNNYVYKQIEENDITELLYELEDTRAYLEEVIKVNHSIHSKIHNRMDVLSLTGQSLTDKQMKSYTHYVKENNKCTDTLNNLIDGDERRTRIEETKKILYKKEQDLEELFYPLQKLSDEQFVAILHLEGMAMLGKDVLETLDSDMPLVIEDKRNR